MTMKKIIAIIIAGILLSSLVFFLFIYNDPEFRYFIGTSTGLKDKPVLTDNNFTIEEVVVGIQASTALTFIEDDILFCVCLLNLPNIKSGYIFRRKKCLSAGARIAPGHPTGFTRA